MRTTILVLAVATLAACDDRGWDKQTSQTFLKLCASANAEKAAVLIHDCGCELARWKESGITYARWSKTPQDAATSTAEFAITQSCTLAAGERTWPTEKRAEHHRFCLDGKNRLEFCDCMLRIAVTRNLDPPHLQARIEAKDEAVMLCQKQ